MNSRQAELVEQFEADARSALAVFGLDVAVLHDFGELVDIFARRNPEMQDPVNPTYNPARRSISADSFWLKATDRDGALVGTYAMTIERSGDLLADMLGGGLWYDAGLPEDWSRMAPVVVGPATSVRGPYSHAGAVFIEPAWRKYGVGRELARIARATTLRVPGLEFVTGFILEALASRNAGQRLYGYPPGSVDLILSGYWPVVQRDVRLYLCHMPAGQALNLMSAELRAA